MNPEKPVQKISPVTRSTRTVYRRRISLLRAGLVAAITSVALILFILWYRAYPQKLDCHKQAQRIAVALEDYRLKNKSLPPLLDILPVKMGRYNIEHYEYYFSGLGGPEILPDKTLIAYCTHPHRAMLMEPWRSVIFFDRESIALKTMSEKEFQSLRSKLRPSEKY